MVSWQMRGELKYRRALRLRSAPKSGWSGPLENVPQFETGAAYEWRW